MKFWIGKEIITPSKAVLQCGFASRTKKSEGVHDDTYVSLVLIKENMTVLMITLDVVYGDRSFSYGIKEAIKELYHIPSEQIIINYSHTHSSVAITGERMDKRNHRPYSMVGDKFYFYGDKTSIDFTVDEAYYNLIKTSILKLLEKGFSNLINGELLINKSKSMFGISRRLKVDKKVEFRPNDNDDDMDQDLYILKFIDSNKKIRGIVYNYACHPSAIGSSNFLLSADYVGEVRKQLTMEFSDAEVVFLQGCGADIKPRCCSDGQYFFSSTFEQLKIGSKQLVSDISKAINTGSFEKIEVNLSCQESNFSLHTKTYEKSYFEKIYNDEKEAMYRRDSAQAIIENMDNNIIFNQLPFYMNIIRLNDTNAILALENEISSDLSKMIKEVVKDNVVVLGYSNSISGYIPTKDMLLNGGYESENFMMVRLAGPFYPEIEDVIIKESRKLIMK